MGKENEVPLLVKSNEVSSSSSSDYTTFYQELKTLSSMAAPMVAVTVSQYLLQVVFPYDPSAFFTGRRETTNGMNFLLLRVKWGL